MWTPLKYENVEFTAIMQHLMAKFTIIYKQITVYAIYFESLIFRESGLQDISAHG